ncbi:hypothetical protein D3C85_988200 [compost metagenome]
MVPTPRTTTVEPAVGSPEAELATTPGALPCSKLPRFTEVTSFSCEPLTVVTALEISDFFLVV